MSTQPSCFGKSWDPNHVECKGGLDPAYSNPRTGTKVRDECSWFNSCRQQVQGRPLPSPQLLPSTSLLRPSAAPQRPMTPPYSPPRPTYAAPPTHYSLPTAIQHVPQAPPAPQVQHIPIPSYQPQYHPPASHHQQPQPQHHQVAPPNYVPAHLAQLGPAYVPMPYQMPGSQMPQYLTVPEPVTDDTHWMQRLLRELFRSVVKAFGHQLAAHVDSHSFRRHDKQ